MDAELKNLQIDRSSRRSAKGPAPSAWIWVGVVALALAGGFYLLLGGKLGRAFEVETVRVRAISAASAPEGVVFNATGYIVSAHKIELAAKVIGKVKWIGVDRGDRVREGQVLVRLEDDEYQAQLLQAKGQLEALKAKLEEALHGSRPEEISQALANLNSSKADLDNANVTLDRTRKLAHEGIIARQSLDDAQARYDSALHKTNALRKAYELVALGPRQEEIDGLRGQVQQAEGAVAYAETNLANTVIRAPVSGTILERAVEKGEFVTTSFVGDRGAKGYVVSLADLNDLEVELDISQNDFARLRPSQPGIVTTDAFPDRKYEGYIKEIAPEANRQKATVQIKVGIAKPDEYLRPEMNASVAFTADRRADRQAVSGAARPVVVVPASAVRDNAVFVVVAGKASRRPIRTGAGTDQGIRVEEGLAGGEDLILNPPAGLKDGDKVRHKE
jgi:HlyD family secretion protein